MKELVGIMKKWLQDNRERALASGFSLELCESTAVDVESAFISFDSELRMARATVWGEGYCDLEILDVPSERNVLYQHLEGVDTHSLGSILDAFWVQLIT